MKNLIISLILFAVLTGVIICHSVAMIKFGEKTEELTHTIQNTAENGEWEKTRESLKAFEKLWNKMKKITVLTLKTNVIDEIDISLEQCKAHAESREKPDFLNECIRLKRYIHSIVRQECLNIDEIL